MAARAELLAAVGTRYRGAKRAERSRILDEFAAVTGYHRKHAIRLLSGGGDREEPGQVEGSPAAIVSRRCIYGTEVRDALIQLWEVADRVCSKRLRPMVPVLLPALERHGRVVVDETTRAKLLMVSAASIDRLLAEVRMVAGGGRRRPAGFGWRYVGACRSGRSTTGATRLRAGSRWTSWRMAAPRCRGRSCKRWC